VLDPSLLMGALALARLYSGARTLHMAARDAGVSVEQLLDIENPLPAELQTMREALLAKLPTAQKALQALIQRFKPSSPSNQTAPAPRSPSSSQF